MLLTVDASVPEKNSDTDQVFLPQMPSGNGQIELVDKLYPSGGNNKKRTQALMRTLQYFPQDKRTLFRVGVRLAEVDWTAGRPQDGHERLVELLAKYAGAIDAEVYTWGEYMDGLILRDLHKSTEAADRMRRIVSATGISVSRRADATGALADLLFVPAPEEALAALQTVAALPEGNTPAIESRLGPRPSRHEQNRGTQGASPKPH